MCDKTIEDTAISVINEYTNAELAFTAFDVTKKVREDLNKQNFGTVSHADVREVLTRMFHSGEMPNYVREIGSGYTSLVQPMVYKLGPDPIVDDLADDSADEPADPEAKKSFWDQVKSLLVGV
jgi:hypothetical protein